MILANADLISKWFAAVAITHEEAVIAKAGEKGRESPNSDGMGFGPGFPSVI